MPCEATHGHVSTKETKSAESSKTTVSDLMSFSVLEQAKKDFGTNWESRTALCPLDGNLAPISLNTTQRLSFV